MCWRDGRVEFGSAGLPAAATRPAQPRSTVAHTIINSGDIRRPNCTLAACCRDERESWGVVQQNENSPQFVHLLAAGQRQQQAKSDPLQRRPKEPGSEAEAAKQCR
jgi:hypothetical protein